MSRSRKPRPRLRIDALESRALLTVFPNPLTHVLELTGTNGSDTFTVTQAANVLTVKEGTGANPPTFTYDLTKVSISRIAADLLGGNDTLTCTDDVLLPVGADGGTGADFIRGGGRADGLVGGDQNDRLDGGAGNDTLTGGDGFDNLAGGVGNDVADGGEDNDTISGGIGNDTLEGWSGVDRIHGDDGNDHISGSTNNDFLWGDKGFDYIHGGEDDNDRIWGGTENDTLDGATGNDTVLGELGEDFLLGGDGNDSLNGGDGNDTLDGGANRDTLVGGNAIDSLTGGTGNDSLSGDGAGATLPGNDILFGGEGNDILNGDRGHDTAEGEAGRDTVLGGDGNDTLRGGAGNDSVRGGNGADRAYGGEHTDRVFGDAGPDQLFGDSGTDTLDGGAQDDVLVSIDNDTADNLWGRTGFDSFWVDDGGAALDNIRDETGPEAETNLHFVDVFANVLDGADKTLDGDGIADPSGGDSSEDFAELGIAGLSLFGRGGPTVTDIDQGALADCWLLATLAAAVDVSPNVARQLIVDLGDGTYAVHVRDAVLNTDEFFRVDTDLPVDDDDRTRPQFAGLGADGDSLWVPLVEKAWAIDKDKDYLNLESQFDPFSQTGTSYYPLGQIGGTDRHTYHLSDGDLSLGNLAANATWAGTYWTDLDDADAEFTVDSHCYAILGVVLDANGDPTHVRLYNPHGEDNRPLYNEDGTPRLDAQGNQVLGPIDEDGDGDTEDDDDGFMTLTVEQFLNDAQDPYGVITADFNAFLP